MSEEKPEWIGQVESLLTIKQQQVAELKRFCDKFGIKTIRTVDKAKITIEQAIEDWRHYFITNAGELSITPTSNKPFLAISLKVKIHGRNIHVHNGKPQGKETALLEEDVFSDESWEIANAIAKVWGGQIKTYTQYIEDSGEPYADTLTVVLPDGDYFEVAYNRLY